MVLNGLFAMTELAVVSSRRSKLQSRAERGDKGARAALKLAEDPTHFLSAVQVGITLIGILAGAYGQAAIAGELNRIIDNELPGPGANGPRSSRPAWSSCCITYVSLIVGELVPKRLALIFPESIASKMAAPISTVAIVLKPFVVLLTASTSGILKIMGVKDRDGSDVTQEEVETMIAEGTSAGSDRARRTDDDRGDPDPRRPSDPRGHDAAPRGVLDRPGRHRRGAARGNPHLPLFADRGGARERRR